jgi:hypothetical protein
MYFTDKKEIEESFKHAGNQPPLDLTPKGPLI